MQFDWALVQSSLPLLAAGLYTTIKISLLAMLLGAVLGAVLGLVSLSRYRAARWAVMGYVDFIRGTPLLVQIFLVYFALPVLGLRVSAGPCRGPNPAPGVAPPPTPVLPGTCVDLADLAEIEQFINGEID